MQVAAKLKYARISPQKCRLVADMVRGQPVGRALATRRVPAPVRARRDAEARGARARAEASNQRISRDCRRCPSICTGT